MVERLRVNVRTAQRTDRKPFIRYFLCKLTSVAAIVRKVPLLLAGKKPFGALTFPVFKISFDKYKDIFISLFLNLNQRAVAQLRRRKNVGTERIV